MNEKISISKGLLIILLITLITSGGAFCAYQYFAIMKKQRGHESQYNILAIVQSTNEKEPLKNVFLSEILNLSYDKPVNLYEFNTFEGVQKLLKTVIIKNAFIKKISPGTLYIEYSLRTPKAYLADYSNSGIDEEGIIFPYKPFITPKKLPEIYFGLKENFFQWGKRLPQDQWDLGLEVLDQLDLIHFNLKKMDLSNAFNYSEGHREVVLFLESVTNNKRSVILRLNPLTFKSGLKNFNLLDKYLNQRLNDFNLLHSFTASNEGESKILFIDLRIDKLAYLSMISEEARR